MAVATGHRVHVMDAFVVMVGADRCACNEAAYAFATGYAYVDRILFVGPWHD